MWRLTLQPGATLQPALLDVGICSRTAPLNKLAPKFPSTASRATHHVLDMPVPECIRHRKRRLLLDLLPSCVEPSLFCCSVINKMAASSSDCCPLLLVYVFITPSVFSRIPILFCVPQWSRTLYCGVGFPPSPVRSRVAWAAPAGASPPSTSPPSCFLLTRP